MDLLNKLQKWLHWDKERKILFMEAFFYLGLSRFQVLTIPFKIVAPHLGIMCRTDNEVEMETDLVVARKVAWAIRLAAKHTPWESNCLPQAMTAHWMLHRRGLPSMFYLGVGRDEDGEMIAHAWLRSGDFFVCGGDGRKRFGVTGVFYDSGLPFRLKEKRL